jgi:hypothetical protein
MRVLVIFLLVTCAGCILLLFWNEEVKYALPTPLPAGYAPVDIGTPIAVGMLIPGIDQAPYYIHFYNPDCPCSRFNSRHVKSLIRQHRDSVSVIVVIPSSKHLARARQTLGGDLRYVADEQQEIARACGVYATPQAVIIDRGSRLYYRGNYNRARYCTSKATNFAEMALLSLLNGQEPPSLGLLATEAYGCELPQNETEPSSLNISLWKK